MNITFDTKIVDASLAIEAMKLYRAREFKKCEDRLLDILDVEPSNWYARLMLAVCYYKTSQFAAAQRAFRFIWSKCTDEDIRRNACHGLQTSTAMLQKDRAAEFGVAIERTYRAPAWMD